MISIDSNILFPAIETENPNHQAAAGFLKVLHLRSDVALSEFMLIEVYQLLRNPATMRQALSPSEAESVCQTYRRHPRWRLIGFPSDTHAFHDALWPRLAERQFARRRAYDWRMALSLMRQGVTEFATVNIKDFADFGFSRVWNPLEELAS